MKKIFLSVIPFALVFFSGCKKEHLNSESIFKNKTAEKTQFDKWLQKNYVDAYNLDFKYRFEDIESDMHYNLSPASYTQSVHIARLTKYLWFEAYDELMGNQNFMRTYSPRIILLVGSPALNPEQGTETLGTAEGGLKITLYKVNDIDKMNTEQRNFYFFRTMHHEFAHILHQTINYPKEFEQISLSDYTSADWNNKSDREMYCKGFVSAYGSSEPREDFVEYIAHYVTHSPEYWNAMLALADSTYRFGRNIINPERLKGSKVMKHKLNMIKTYLKDSWKIDLDRLRDIVQRRTDNIDNLNLDDISLSGSSPAGVKPASSASQNGMDIAFDFQHPGVCKSHGCSYGRRQ